MIGWLLERAARGFGRRYGYDVNYMLDVIETSRSAGARLLIGPQIIQYRGPQAARSMVSGAYLASTLDGDCGPCAQLVVDMGIEAGVSASALRACTEGRMEAAGDVGLGFAFARAAIFGEPAAQELGDEIERRFGRKALVAASFGAAMGRFYPVFKRGMGHGAACQRLDLGTGPEVLSSLHG